MPANSVDQWNDWTSTWRRMGKKGESKPVTMTGTITRGRVVKLINSHGPTLNIIYMYLSQENAEGRLSMSSWI